MFGAVSDESVGQWLSVVIQNQCQLPVLGGEDRGQPQFDGCKVFGRRGGRDHTSDASVCFLGRLSQQLVAKDYRVFAGFRRIDDPRGSHHVQYSRWVLEMLETVDVVGLA